MDVRKKVATRKNMITCKKKQGYTKKKDKEGEKEKGRG